MADKFLKIVVNVKCSFYLVFKLHLMGKIYIIYQIYIKIAVYFSFNRKLRRKKYTSTYSQGQTPEYLILSYHIILSYPISIVLSVRFECLDNKIIFFLNSNLHFNLIINYLNGLTLCRWVIAVTNHLRLSTTVSIYETYENLEEMFTRYYTYSSIVCIFDQTVVYFLTQRG